MPVYYSYRIYNISLFDLCLTSFCTLYFMSCVCSTFLFYYCISTRTQIFPFFEILFGFIQIYSHIDRRQYSHMETFTKNNADDHIEQYCCAFICCFNMKRFFDNLNTKSITWWAQTRAYQLFFCGHTNQNLQHRYPCIFVKATLHHVRLSTIDRCKCF